MTATKEPTEEELLELLVQTSELTETDPKAALELVDKSAFRNHPEVRLARARGVWAAEGPEACRLELEAMLGAYSDFADLHAELALVCAELEDDERAVQHNLNVLRLDARQDQELGFDASEYEGMIVKTAEEALASFPEEFRSRLQNVPILLEERPSEDLVREGFDPRALGLFEGPDFEAQAGAQATDRPTRIVLYTANLTAMAEDADALKEEVQITVLHEVGHFFGLEEDDMERLGLD